MQRSLAQSSQSKGIFTLGPATTEIAQRIEQLKIETTEIRERIENRKRSLTVQTEPLARTARLFGR